MEELFLDTDHSKMVRELGFDLPELKEDSLFKYYGNYVIGSGIMLQQVEQWLWEKNNRIWILVERGNGEYFVEIFKEGISIESITQPFNSPITAKNEGIKKAIEYLYEQSKNK